MAKKRKKSPSVKIPSAVLKKEAQKMAKQIMKKEEQKERNRIAREKTKQRAKRKVEIKKDQDSTWESYYYGGVSREVWASIWIFVAITLVALFSSQASVGQSVTRGFLSVFGMGIWVLPVIFVGLGILLFVRKEEIFPPQRIVALIGFYIFLLGIFNLLVPHSESLSESHRYGGAAGFSIGFFPREYFGDLFAWVLILAGFWVSAVIGFGLNPIELIRRSILVRQSVDRQKSNTTKSSIKSPGIEVKGPKIKKEKVKESKVETKKEVKGRFKNELEIVDSSIHQSKVKPKENTIKVEPEDELTKNKNQTFGEWEPPSLDILSEASATITVNEKKLREKAEAIRDKLEQFGLEVTMKSVHVGPTVTQFTLEPSPGVKLNKITALKNDLTLALAAPSLRIEAPIRGQKLVGIEIPNKKRATVSMREILESEAWEKESKKSRLTLALGRDVAGKPVVANLAKMPHLLIAGKTGSGKSVGMNAFLVSLLWQNSPDQLRLILIDPKRVELKPYDNLPHLLTPVIVEPEKSVSALAWAVAEMNRRYKRLSEKGVRNLEEYNEKFPEEKEPFIVIVIDELADLMMVAGKDVEAAICRIAQMARAVGMHLIVATQRPSVDVVTGLIKANLPARIAFRVNTGIDSRTIIDGIGAEDLLGFGDMLYLDGNSGDLSRVQGLYVSTEEVDRVTNHIKIQFPEMIANDEITEQSIEGMAKGGVLTAGMDKDVSDDDLDAKYEEAVQVILDTNKASASYLQRRLEVGYARAARILDQMESRGIIGPARGAKPREIYGRNE